VISQDPLISTMISNHKVDIVISSGSLTALVNIAMSEETELEIPIEVVKTIEGNINPIINIVIHHPF
jgi:hypothetical protein